MNTNDNHYWRYITKRLLFVVVVCYVFTSMQDRKKRGRERYSGNTKVNTILKGVSGKVGSTALTSASSFFSLKSF